MFILSAAFLFIIGIGAEKDYIQLELFQELRR
ncbi:hypothetical protein FSEG_02153 [Fusobacterium necrophorum D12]|nr:hypothetical protein FSEG_02153 [Fusobacterium necrophorum D12]